MSADQIKTPTLQKIAADQLQRVFPEGLSSRELQEMTISLVRQWRTNEGHAALFTEARRCWLALSVKAKGKINVQLQENQGHPLAPFFEKWDFDPEQSAEIIERLNIAQSAEFRNRSGDRLRMWVEPKKRRLSIEPITATDEV